VHVHNIGMLFLKPSLKGGGERGDTAKSFVCRALQQRQATIGVGEHRVPRSVECGDRGVSTCVTGAVGNDQPTVMAGGNQRIVELPDSPGRATGR
jgi:hypothetical protein